MLPKALRTADWTLVALILAVPILALAIDLLSDQHLRSLPRLILGVLFAVVPAGLWVAVFYRQDRVEPEPKHLVATVAVVAGLAAAAVAEPLLRLTPRPEGPVRWLTAVLVVGLLRELTKYLAVRLVAVPAGEMDERADGIIYGTAAGVGYATAINLSFVIAAGGAEPATGFAWMTAVILVHGALGGMVGYLVARDHLETVPAWWLPGGLVVAALIGALFFEARTALVGVVSSPASSPLLGSWLGILMALVVAMAITVALIRAMRREEAVAP